MSDQDLRTLERLSARSPEDRYRYRVAMVRYGRGHELKLTWGDRVSVDGESRTGTVRHVLKNLVKIVFPINERYGVLGKFYVNAQGRNRRIRIVEPSRPSLESAEYEP